ncbi:BPSL0067 family protein [Paraburkholderia megapolitana]|uniref:BPSL0067 family protein n=1 Tax=Paraburkholderia megapolitana TaxID=420953 RepID=UPI0038BD3F7D
MPYIYSLVTTLEGKPKVGNKQCVALVRQYTAAPATANWEAGARVQDGGLILPGTAIATMVNGHYPNHPHGNHAAFFLRKEGACIVVMDQWASDTTKPVISSRRICPKGKHANGTYVDPSNNADAYFIVE